MIAVDSSVAIAAFGEWHELHDAAARIVDEGAAIPALTTADRRALPVYELVGVEVLRLGGDR